MEQYSHPKRKILKLDNDNWILIKLGMYTLGWGGIRVAGFSLLHGYHPNPATSKVQHTSKQEHTTIVVIQ